MSSSTRPHRVPVSPLFETHRARALRLRRGAVFRPPSAARGIVPGRGDARRAAEILLMLGLYADAATRDPRSRPPYMAVSALSGLGLWRWKITSVTFPFVLLLLEVWTLDRCAAKRAGSCARRFRCSRGRDASSVVTVLDAPRDADLRAGAQVASIARAPTRSSPIGASRRRGCGPAGLARPVYPHPYLIAPPLACGALAAGAGAALIAATSLVGSARARAPYLGGGSGSG